MSAPAFDEILRRLAGAEVRFVVVGGLALGAWGVVHGTKDVDIVVASDPENLKRVAEVAVAIRGHVQTGEALLGSQPSILLALPEQAQLGLVGRGRLAQGRLEVVRWAQGHRRVSDAGVWFRPPREL